MSTSSASAEDEQLKEIREEFGTTTAPCPFNSAELENSMKLEKGGKEYLIGYMKANTGEEIVQVCRAEGEADDEREHDFYICELIRTRKPLMDKAAFETSMKAKGWKVSTVELSAMQTKEDL